jgi:hypothetical protein
MPDLATKMSPCGECVRLREQYARATGRRELAKADLIAAMSSHDRAAVSAAQAMKVNAVREWETALADLEAHLASHGHQG